MKDMNILVFGDSISYGACDTKNSGWVNILKLSLANRNNLYCPVFNLGIPGNTTEDLKNRFKYECDARYDIESQMCIIFSIGINDSKIINGKNKVPQNLFMSNIIELITQSLQYTNNILFVGLTRVDESKVTPVPWNTDISYSNKEIAKFDKSLSDICNENNINYLDISNLLDKDSLEDGLHPNSKGHQQIFEKIYKQLEELKWI